VNLALREIANKYYGKEKESSKERKKESCKKGKEASLVF
jgi:hypothetical protein